MATKDRSSYALVDFVLDDDFIRWVHFNAPADDAWWQQWLQENAHQHDTVMQARLAVQAISIDPGNVSDADITAATAQLLRTIRQKQEAALQEKRVIRKQQWWLAAAVVLPLLLAAFLFRAAETSEASTFSYASVTQSKHLTERVNTTAQALQLQLPDGSSVTLWPNSKISYAAHAGDSIARDIYLSGQASFVVAKNAGRPFRVFANEIVTQVLGTRFTIAAFEKEKTIQVTVQQGKVSVHSQLEPGNEQAGSSEHVLTANQQVAYDRQERKFTQALLTDPAIIDSSSFQKPMILEDTPVPAVLEQLKTAYGISISYDATVLQHCTISADFTNEPFYRRLDLLCQAIGASYTVSAAGIAIQAAGCR